MPRRHLLALAISQLAAFSAAQAATITVTTPSDAVAVDAQCSLPEAIANANANDQSGSTECTAGTAGNDTIELPSEQTITLGSALPNITEALTISGNGATLARDNSGGCTADFTTDAGEFRLLTSTVGDLQLSVLTLQDGCASGMNPAYRGGAVLLQGGNNTFSGVTASGNKSLRGGAIALTAGGTLTIQNSMLSNNSGSLGGALYVDASSTLSIGGSTISGNTGSSGSALYSFGDVTIANSTINGNSATWGGIYVAQSNLSLTSVTLSGNTTSSTGAAVTFYNGAGYQLTIVDSTISGNTSNGGSVFIYGGTATIQGSRFTDNTADGNGGGAIYASGVDLLLENSTVSGNSAGDDGGGLRVIGGSTTTIERSTIENNHSTGRGGGLRHSGTLTLIASTLSGNTATGNGGGLYADGSSVTISDSTFAYNDGASSDQFRSIEASFATTRSLFVGDGTDNCYSSIAITGSDNLATDSTSCAFATATTLQALNLQPLALQGGATSTHALGFGSSAIDAGGTGCSGTDQRGEARPFNSNCDVGAFEVQEAAQVGPDFVVNSSDDGVSDGFCGSLADECTLGDAIVAANSNADASQISFDSGVFSGTSTLSLTSALPTLRSDISLVGGGIRIERDGSVDCDLNGAVVPGEFRLLDADGSLGVLTLSLSNLTLANGCADAGAGGAIRSLGAYLSIDQVNFSGNAARYGGGAVESDTETTGSLTITGSSFSGNSAQLNGGGAVLVRGMPASLSDSTLTGNVAISGGAVISYQSLGVSNSLLSGNSASHGGGMYVIGHLQLDNSTLSGNSASVSGGGFYLYGPDGGVGVADSTLSGNQAPSGDQFGRNVENTISVVRSLFDGSGSDNCAGVGGVLSGNDNLSTDASCSSFGTTEVAVGALLLQPLADNGGPTQTHLPQAGSPALDAASGCSGSDQRGEARAVDGDAAASASECDIGAVEFQYSLLTAMDENGGTLGEDDSNTTLTNVLLNEVDADDDYTASFSVSAVNGSSGSVGGTVSATGGSFVIAGNGNASFTPDGVAAQALDDGESQDFSINYTVSDGLGSDVATLSVTVNGANDAPSTESSSASTSENTPVTAALLATDIDVESLTASLVSAPSAGSVSFDNPNLMFTFNPNGAFEALDDGESQLVSFQYKVNDGDVDSNTSTVNITVNGANDAPVAGAVALAAADIGISQGSFDGSDVDSADTLTYVITSAPAQGSVSNNGDGTFAFDPNGEFDDLADGNTRQVSFQYTADDGDATSLAPTVTVTVTGSNSAPTVAAVAASTDQDSSVGGGFDGSDDDTGDTLTYTITTQPAAGTVVNNGDGSFSFDPAGAFDDLDDGESRQATFQYTASDGTTSSSAATVTITVNGLNDAPIASSLALAAADVGVTQGSFDGSDADSADTLAYVITSAPAQGLVSNNGDGTFAFDPNGEFDDLPAGTTRQVSFQYTADDGNATSPAATITVTVTGSNSAPTVAAVAASTDQDSSVDGSFDGSDDDTGDTLDYTITVQPAAGTVVNNGDGSFSFDPAGAFDDLEDGESRQATFQYTASDGTASSSAATVTITVNGLNDLPVAADDSYVVVGGQTLNVAVGEGLLANDTDIDVENLAVVAGTFTPSGVGGTLVLAADGSFTYTAPVAVGTAGFNYTLSDGSANVTGSLTINVLSSTALDLEITKSDGVTAVAANDVLTYTINVVNHGPADAVDARVQDALPADLQNASWTCEAVPPSAATACGSASGSGDIDQQVDIASGDSVVFELMATMAERPSDSTLSNTATVAAAGGFTDFDLANNSATDVDSTTRVFHDGFESAVVSKRFAARAMQLDAAAISARLPHDAGYKPVLVARASSNAGLVLVHARRVGGGVEVRLSRFEHEQWQQGEWVRVREARIRLEW